MNPLTRRTVAGALLASVTLAGCAGTNATETDDSDDVPQSAAEQPVRVAVASYDLAVGEDQRFTAGLLLTDGGLLVGGEVSMELFYFGTDGTGTGESLGVQTARFLPVPGIEPDPPSDEPTLATGGGTGVYETYLDFPEPGRYGVGVLVEHDEETLQGTTTFDVAAEHAIVEVGEPAPTVENPVMDDDVEPAVIDSRARDGAEVPDPQLHQTTLTDAVAAGKRSIVLLSTPVYCVSRFCGPITEQVEQLADETGDDDLAVIHIEVWEDFGAQQLHPAAAAWIQTETGGNEPWLFVVDADGTVLGRWDNVVDLDAVRDLLDL